MLTEVPLQTLPQIGLSRELERGRHDSHDGEGGAIQAHHTADHALITTKPAMPEPMTDDGLRFGAVQCGVDLEAAADYRRNAKYLEKILTRFYSRNTSALARTICAINIP